MRGPQDDSAENIVRSSLAIIFSILLLIVSLAASWHLFAQINFLYPVWHDAVGIGTAIEKYGPRNPIKSNFDRTTKQERVRLFAAMVDSIHKNGEGLENLVYRDEAGRTIDTLLTEPEIVHLRDVARLLSSLNVFALVSALVTLALALVMLSLRIPPPSLKHLGAGLLGVALVTGVTLLAAGPVKLFYWLHTVVFPAEHKWFFYYEESLMSMMMKAPALFGPIAAELAAGAVVIWLLVTWGMRAMTRRVAAGS